MLVDGKPAYSCVTPVSAIRHRKIETIESLGEGDKLHPVQSAFLAEEALQCGYCTPGMIMTAVALLREKPHPSEDEIVAAMNRNICRCGTYVRILRGAESGERWRCVAMKQRRQRQGDMERGRQGDAARRTSIDRRTEIRNPDDVDYDELLEPIRFRFAVDRRSFVQMLGAGVLITAIGTPLLAQRFGGGRRRGGGFFGGPPAPLSARFHFADDGTITVFSGKVDAGQGARCELAQAAAEELRVPLERVKVVLSDTAVCPNDGMTAGSATTPRTVPAVRQAAAAVRKLLSDGAAEKWTVAAESVEARDGKIIHTASGKEATYSSSRRTTR